MHRDILKGSVIGAIVLAAIQMIYEALFGIGFWAAPTTIAAILLRDLQTLDTPVPFMPGAVILGIIIHIVAAILLGYIFSAAFSRMITTRGSGTGLGALYGLIVFIVMWFIVLPILNPVMLELNGYIFALGHLVWGGILGYYAVPKTVDVEVR